MEEHKVEIKVQLEEQQKRHIFWYSFEQDRYGQWKVRDHKVKWSGIKYCSLSCFIEKLMDYLYGCFNKKADNNKS